MEIVIKISEKTVNEIKDNAMFADSISSDIRWDITSAIVNGIPLPKGHGKLKDIDKFLKRVEGDRKHECYLHSWTIDDVLQRLDSWYAPIIIEADKAGK